MGGCVWLGVCGWRAECRLVNRAHGAGKFVARVRVVRGFLMGMGGTFAQELCAPHCLVRYKVNMSRELACVCVHAVMLVSLECGLVLCTHAGLCVNTTGLRSVWILLLHIQ